MLTIISNSYHCDNYFIQLKQVWGVRASGAIAAPCRGRKQSAGHACRDIKTVNLYLYLYLLDILGTNVELLDDNNVSHLPTCLIVSY